MGRFVIRRTPTGVKFDLRAANGEVIATSEVYTSEAFCRKGVASVQRNAPLAHFEDQTAGDRPVSCPKFELYLDRAGAYRFRLRARNGQVIATSEGYGAKAAAQNGIESVRKNAADAGIVTEN